MSGSYAVVVVRLERMAGSRRLLVRATVRVDDGENESERPLVLEPEAVAEGLAPILEAVGARLSPPEGAA